MGLFTSGKCVDNVSWAHLGRLTDLGVAFFFFRVQMNKAASNSSTSRRKKLYVFLRLSSSNLTPGIVGKRFQKRPASCVCLMGRGSDPGSLYSTYLL